jgi:hypothetical protein
MAFCQLQLEDLSATIYAPSMKIHLFDWTLIQTAVPHSAHKAIFALLGTFMALSIHAQTFEGNNSSSERVTIEVGANGVAVVAWYPRRLGTVSIKELWAVSPEVKGFKLVAPAGSLLKKPGDNIKYTRISSNSTSMHCSAGCAYTMPNLIGKSN